VNFLQHIKQEDKNLEQVITANTNTLMNFYCQGFTSRLLRTNIKKRNGERVSSLITKFKEFAVQLDSQGNYKPLNNFIVRMALIIDSNVVTRNAFLLFKKIYTKPVYKN
jgi:hypothetical protein